MLRRVRKRFVCVIALLGALACRSKLEPASEPPAPASAGSQPVHAEKDVVPGARAQPGDLTRCPVSNVVFRVEADSPRVEHAGKRGFVCCEGCKQHFDAAPDKFAKLL
jgi:YHS domain-containing protein